MALDVKAKTEKLLKDNGWEPNPEQTVGRRTYDHEAGNYIDVKVQNPNAWRKLAEDGVSYYKLVLEHQRKRGRYNGSETSTLKAAYFTLKSPHFEHATQIGVLTQPSNWRHVSAIYDALEDEQGGERSLRDKLNLIIVNPKLTHWFVAEEEYQIVERRRMAREASDADDALRAQPLPITIPAGEYSFTGGSFKELARKLQDAAERLTKVDGKSNLPELVAAAHLALAAIEGVLTDEASLEMGEIIMNSVIAAEEPVSV